MDWSVPAKFVATMTSWLIGITRLPWLAQPTTLHFTSFQKLISSGSSKVMNKYGKIFKRLKKQKLNRMPSVWTTISRFLLRVAKLGRLRPTWSPTFFLTSMKLTTGSHSLTLLKTTPSSRKTPTSLLAIQRQHRKRTWQTLSSLKQIWKWDLKTNTRVLNMRMCTSNLL